MERRSLDYRPARNDVVTSPIPQVERCADGRVVIRASYPPGKFREAVIGAIVACGALVVFPILFVWFAGGSLPARGRLALLPWMLFAALVTWIVFGRVLRMGQSYTLEVDRDGITIQRVRG